MNKKYLNISDASKILGLDTHIIRYWDSIDPKTNQIRIDGLSTKSRGGTRYFSKDNIAKLQKLKNLLYDNGEFINPTKLADKILTNKKILNSSKNTTENLKTFDHENSEKIHQILTKMRKLLEK